MADIATPANDDNMVIDMPNQTADSSRVYVAPIPYSLDSLLEICKNDSVSSGITELVFITDVLEEGFAEDVYHDEGKYMAAVERRYVCCHEALPKDFIFNTDNLLESFEFYEKLRDRYSYDAEITEEVLTQCLPNLPNLRKVVIAKYIDADKPGLNDDCCFWTKYCPKGQTYKETLTPWQRIAVDFISLSDAGTDKLIWALAQSGLPITSLEIGTGVRYQEYFYDLSGPYHRVDEASFQTMARNLTQLSMHISNNENISRPYHEEQCDGECTCDFWKGFFAAATNLAELRIYPSQWFQWQEHGNFLDTILEHNTFSKLSSLEIIGRPDYPANVRATALKGFADRHATTLRHITFSNVLLVNWYEAYETDDMMGSVIKHLKRTLQLETATVLLHRGSTHVSNGDCKGGCEKYPWIYGDCKISVRSLDALAKALEVTLNDDKWDFGEYLMR